MLGDSIEKAGKAIGVKPCEGCKKRKEALNKAEGFTRRLFINRGVMGGSLMLLLLGKNQLVKAAWQAVGEVPDLQLGDVLGFVRTANTTQHEHWLTTKSYHNRGDLLTAVASHREHMPATDSWMSRYTPLAKQPLPQWDVDAHADAESYRIIVTGPEYVFVTDEVGTIYRAPVTTDMPNARDLNKAENFPGAVRTGELPLFGALPVPKPMSTWERVKAFLTPTTSSVLALDCCSSSCACSGRNCPIHWIWGNCGACKCIYTCCDTGNCYTNSPPPGVCFANLGTGLCANYGGFTCNWYAAPCNLATCGACAWGKFATCCRCTGGTCPN